MRNTVSAAVTVAIFAASLGAPTLPSWAGEVVDQMPTAFYFFCRSDYQMGKTFYFSTTQQAAAGTTRNELTNSYRTYLAKTYKYPNDKSISCVYAVNGDLQGRTESTRQQTIEALHVAQFEVVETTAWKYSK